MSCRRAFDVDLADFLARASAPDFADFRAHYPRCPDCAPEVRAWTEIDFALRGATTHPEPDRLLRFVEHRDALDAAEGAALERHLAACAPCRDELAALGRFDFETLRGEAPRGWRLPTLALPRLARVVLHPAFAYALVLLLLYPALVDRLGPAARHEVPASREQDVKTTGSAPPRAAREERAAEPKMPAAGNEPPVVPRERLRSLGRVDEAQAPAAAAPALRRDAPGAAVAEPRPEAAAEPFFGRRALVDDADVAAGWRNLVLTPGTPAALRARELTEGVVLRVPVPPGLRAVGVEVRVRDEEGRRELRERFAAPAGEYVATRIARGWLVSGAYRIELSASDGRPAPEVFTVRVEP